VRTFSRLIINWLCIYFHNLNYFCHVLVLKVLLIQAIEQRKRKQTDDIGNQN